MGLDYTNISKTYDDHRSFPDELFTRLVKLGGIVSRTRVLEFGCGESDPDGRERRATEHRHAASTFQVRLRGCQVPAPGVR